MKEQVINHCVTLYGEIESNVDKWFYFYQMSKEIIINLGFIPNYIGLQSKTFKSGKILDLKRTEKRLKKAIEENDDFNSLEVLSLPDKFKQAVFDYNISIIRYKSSLPHNITFMIKGNENYNIPNLDKIIEQLKNYINFSSGKIYQLSKKECPLFYVMQSKSDYNGLKIIKEFK